MSQTVKNLHDAKKTKNDEFYTQFTDVAKELTHYKQHFKNKIVLCNCDDPTWSAFWKYFHLNFAELGLKKLISTHYDREKSTYKMEYEGGDDNNIEVGIKTPLEGNGDFRSQECLDLLDECDIVVTNPPFSCYSSDTEVMTNHGWKFIKDVNIDEDIIMSLNPEDKQIEMVKAVDFISSPVNGELYHFHNQNMDFCVTGNHRMYAYYKDAHSDKKPMPFINAEDVKKSHLLPLKGFSWTGNQKDYFCLPKTVQLEQYSRKEIVVPEKRIPMKDWLEFFGFWLADGCWRDHINTCGKRDYTISIKQNAKNEQYVLDFNEFGICYSINVLFERRTEFSKYGMPDKIPYNDNVYCLTLEKNHIMLVRHNGVIGWCGNCFREYVASLMEHKKKFLIIGNKNAITYKEFFPLLKNNEVWIGCTNVKEFLQPDGSIKKFGNIGWFTNLDVVKRHEKLILWKNYTPEEYPKYDNYDAINVDKISEIPVDYDGVMGVPITFLDNFNPDQFEILGYTGGLGWNELNEVKTSKEYIECKQHNPDGTITSGGKVNTGSTLYFMNIPVQRYYTASNCSGYLLRTYGRILIRKKTSA